MAYDLSFLKMILRNISYIGLGRGKLKSNIYLLSSIVWKIPSELTT